MDGVDTGERAAGAVTTAVSISDTAGQLGGSHVRDNATQTNGDGRRVREEIETPRTGAGPTSGPFVKHALDRRGNCGEVEKFRLVRSRKAIVYVFHGVARI